MSTTLTIHKVESSEGDRFRKYERMHKLMLMCSDVSKKVITEDSKHSYC